MANMKVFAEMFHRMVEELGGEDWTSREENVAGMEQFDAMMAKASRAKSKTTSEDGLTEKGRAILTAMQEMVAENPDETHLSATAIAEHLGWANGKSVSGSMRKLITEELVAKNAEDKPVTYSLVC